MAVGCVKYDDLEFRGTVVNYEICNSWQDMGYLVDLEYPDSVGGTYTVGGTTYHNVVIIYQAGEVLTDQSHIAGRFYWETNYAKLYCNRIYSGREVPEAVFTELTVISD